MFIRVKEFFIESFNHNEPKDFLQSQWQRKDKCLAFLIYRWILAAFFTFSVGFSILINIGRGHFRVYFIYLTHLNLCATMFTTCLSALLVTLHYFNKIKVEKKMPFVMKLYWSLWNHSSVFSCLVSIFYWSIIYKGQPIDLNNVLIHITNSSVILIDMLVVKHPVKQSNFFSHIVTESIYMLFTIIFQFLGGLNKKGQNFVYAESDWKRSPLSAISYFCAFTIAAIAIHCLINLCHKFRQKTRSYFLEKKLKSADQSVVMRSV